MRSRDRRDRRGCVLVALRRGGRRRARIGRAGALSAPSARDVAPIDLTGYWVSYVTENWRYRMVTPAKGEYRRIPVSPAALPIINAWDPAADDTSGQPVQVVRRGRHHERARPPAHHLAGCRHAAHRHRRGHADAALSLHRAHGRLQRAKPTWQGESAARWERVAGA